MKPHVTAAIWEWTAGLLIGLTPLLAHALLHAFATPARQWEDSWTGDLLFVSITNSGLSAVTVFTRVAKGLFKIKNIKPQTFGLMALTMLLFLFSGMLYGIAASGHARDVIIWPAIAILGASLTLLLLFEVALSRP